MGAPVRRFYASRSAEKAAAFERRFRGAGSYGSYEAALADGRIDVAFVATPPASHLELTLRALRSGKDVIVEKPAFLRAADFDARGGRGARRRTGACWSRRTTATSRWPRVLRDVLAAGEIGERALRAPERGQAPGARTAGARTPAEAGGGALFEGGIHWVDLVGEPGTAGALGARLPGRRPAARSAAAWWCSTTKGGGVGTLLHSWEIASPLRGLRLSRIYGTGGSIAFESNGLFVAVLRPAEARSCSPACATSPGIARCSATSSRRCARGASRS